MSHIWDYTIIRNSETVGTADSYQTQGLSRIFSNLKLPMRISLRPSYTTDHIQVDNSSFCFPAERIQHEDTTSWSNECFTIEGGSHGTVPVSTDSSSFFTKASHTESHGGEASRLKHSGILYRTGGALNWRQAGAAFVVDTSVCFTKTLNFVA
jgi:hypothetical protein